MKHFKIQRQFQHLIAYPNDPRTRVEFTMHKKKTNSNLAELEQNISKTQHPKKGASLLETAGVMNSLHLRAVRVRFCALISQQQWKSPSRLSPGEKISQDKARQK